MSMVVGYQKALKMIKNELFYLSSSKIQNKTALDKSLLNSSKFDIQRLVNDFNGYLIHSCDFFKNFTGQDIDLLSKNEKIIKKIYKNIIIRKFNENSFRIHLNNQRIRSFLSLDIENLNNLPKEIRVIFKQKFASKTYCRKTKLNHLNKKGIIFYKLIKYFYLGTIHSYQQLLYLKKDIINLNKKDFDLILSTIKETIPGELNIIKKYLFLEFKEFEKSKVIKQFFVKKRYNRHNKRKIFSGKLIFKNIIFDKDFLYAFFFGSQYKWKNSHFPMPAISIIGNDGSGKTTTVEYIRKHFSKMDPLIFDMKASKPFFSFVLKLRAILKKINQFSIIKNIFFLKIIVSSLGEVLDLFDKYFKYKVGMAWADAGKGITIFERYPTDRVRGEFPSIKNRFMPLEQFFPFPDGMVYLDVLPKNSIKRKKRDNHTFEEMTSKRKNYLSLINEFDEVEIVSASKKMNSNILQIKNYIFKIYKIKRINVIKKQKFKRVLWKKNFNRILAGKNLDKSQKEGFFG